MTPEEFRRLLENFSRGQCTPEEEQFIIDWYEKVGDNTTSPLDREESADIESRIWASIKPSSQPVKRRRMRFLLKAAVITVPLLACALLYFNRQSFIPFFPKGEERRISSSNAGRVFRNDGKKDLKVALADGSVVVLEPSSEVIVFADFGNEKREVELRGGGFFDVMPDARKPFLVYANEVVTRVLGTSFHIRAYKDDKEVTVAVKSGKVSVYANMVKTSRRVTQSDEIILTPNQQMVYHRVREVISKTIVEKPEIIVPQTDHFKMQFDNALVAEIFDALSENYGIRIVYDKETLNNCRLTTSMSDEGLYERIEVICKAIGASYTIGDDATIIIESDGCSI